jgi:hypothetical protein
VSVAASAKARLVGASGVLAALLPTGVKVSYSPPRDILDEAVYGGFTTSGPVALKAMAGGVRVKRSEDLTFHLYVRVRGKGRATTETTDARAVVIADIITVYIAAHTTLDDLAELKLIQVQSIELEGWVDDDGAGTTLTITVAVESYLS